MFLACTRQIRNLWGPLCGGVWLSTENSRINNRGLKPAMPCKVCGVACKVDYRVCYKFGGGKIRRKLKRIDIKAKRDFTAVMKELESKYSN